MIITWIAFLLLGFLSFIIKDAPWFYENRNTVSWYIIFFLSLVFIISMFRKYNARDFDWIALFVVFTGFFIRVFLLYWDLNFRHIFVLPNSGVDSEGFYAAALGLTERRAGNFTRIMGWIFSLFGPQRYIAQFFNLLLGISTIFISLNLLRKVTTNKNSTILLLTVGILLPYYMIMNVIFLREALISFFVTCGLYFFISWFKDGKLWGMFLCMVCSLVVGLLHSGSIIVALGFAVCFVLYDRKRKSFRVTSKTLLQGAFFFMMFFVFDIIFDDALFGRLLYADVASLTTFAERETGDSAYTFFIHTGVEALDFLVNTPFRMLYFLFSPFPWYWRGPFDIIAFIFSAGFYITSYIVAFLALRRKDVINKEYIVMFLILGLVNAFVFGWGVRNIGTAMRHRDKFLSIHLLLLTFSIHSLQVKSIIGQIRSLFYPRRNIALKD